MLTVIDLPGLPPGQYGLIESYCDERDCDCRRVFFNIFDWQTKQFKAVIAYGWESEAFYSKWLGFNNPEIIRELQGPVLNSGSPQSELAPALLAQMVYVLKDRNYVDRLKRHYAMYKAAVEKESGRSIRAGKRPLQKGVHRKPKRRNP
jgi:hypothetical protein